MHLVEVFERGRQLSKDGGRIGQVHAAEIVAPERVDESSAMPLLWGLHTGVLIGFSPSDVAIRRVSSAM